MVQMITLNIALCVFLMLVTNNNLGATQRANQVILTCGGADTSSERGPPGSPGKKGPPGSTGPVGAPGAKGEPGSDDALQEKVARLEQQLRNLEELLNDTSDELKKQPRDCLDAQKKGFALSGDFGFTSPFQYRGYCDMTTDGGGWLVIQKRYDGSVEFYRRWNDYEEGFGSLYGEFWLGLKLLHNITSSGNYELRIDLTNYDSTKEYAKYSLFSIGNPASFYQLSVGGYSGNAGDGLLPHNHMAFSTFDHDHDTLIRNCAAEYHGAWWYKACHHSNLNGRYSTSKLANDEYNRWYGAPNRNQNTRKATEMKIRKRQN